MKKIFKEAKTRATQNRYVSEFKPINLELSMETVPIPEEHLQEYITELRIFHNQRTHGTAYNEKRAHYMINMYLYDEIAYKLEEIKSIIMSEQKFDALAQIDALITHIKEV